MEYTFINVPLVASLAVAVLMLLPLVQLQLVLLLLLLPAQLPLGDPARSSTSAGSFSHTSPPGARPPPPPEKLAVLNVDVLAEFQGEVWLASDRVRVVGAPFL